MNKTTRVLIALLILSISCKCSFIGRLLKKHQKRKIVWEIVSVKDPKLNQFLKTKYKNGRPKITLDGDQLSFQIVNGCSASSEPGLMHNQLMCTCMAAVDQTWNELETYVVDVVSKNLEGLMGGKFLANSTTLNGKSGKELLIALISYTPPQTKA